MSHFGSYCSLKLSRSLSESKYETKYCSVIRKTIQIDKEMLATFQKINHLFNIDLIFYNPTSNKESDCNLYKISLRITEVYAISRFLSSLSLLLHWWKIPCELTLWKMSISRSSILRSLFRSGNFVSACSFNSYERPLVLFTSLQQAWVRKISRCVWGMCKKSFISKPGHLEPVDFLSEQFWLFCTSFCHNEENSTKSSFWTDRGDFFCFDIDKVWSCGFYCQWCGYCFK